MALARRERLGLDWPGDMLRRFFDSGWDGEGWLRVEEFRDGDTLVIRAELPGVDPEKDVELTVADDVLHIRAERQERSENTDKAGYHSEFRYGAFVRNVPLPAGVNQDDIQANYQDGILDVRIPMPKETKKSTTKIAINRS
jgi:HSP20 family protein